MSRWFDPLADYTYIKGPKAKAHVTAMFNSIAEDPIFEDGKLAKETVSVFIYSFGCFIN